MTSLDKPQRILVTGANRGLGLAICKQLAEKGHEVILTSRKMDSAVEAVESLGKPIGKLIPMELDVTSDQSVHDIAEEISRRFGSLSAVVNNAGILLELDTTGALLPMDVPILLVKNTFETNFFGALRVSQAMVPLLANNGGGNIVNISSGLGSLFCNSDVSWEFGGFNLMGYNSSKTALNAQTVILSKALASMNIRVNSADPGYCATGLNGFSGPRSPEMGAEIAVRLALIDKKGPTGGFFCDTGMVPW